MKEIQQKGQIPQSEQVASASTVTNPTGTRLFQGYSVTHLSKKPDNGFLDNLMEFAKFCWDPAYREKMRNDFLERAKLEIKGIDTKEGIGLENQIKALEETIKNIMETSDIVMPENKKMELILFAIKNSSQAVREEVEMASNYLEYKPDNELLQNVVTSHQKASHYFAIKIRDITVNICKLTLSFPQLRESASLNTIFSRQYTISSQEELDFEKMAVSKDVIDVLCSHKIPFDQVKEFIQKLIDDPELNLSKKQGFLLLIHACIRYKDTEGIKKEMEVLLKKIAQSNMPEVEKTNLILMALALDAFKDIATDYRRKWEPHQAV